METLGGGMVTDDAALQRLLDAADENYRDMQPLRDARRERVGLVLGDERRDDDEPRSVTVLPLMAMMLSIFSRYLMSRDPKVLCTTKVRQLRPVAATLRQALSDELCEIRITATMRRLIAQAVLGPAVAKTGVDHQQRTFVEDVDLDNLVCDLAAERWERMTFVGNFYSVPLAWARSVYGDHPSLQPDERSQTPGGGERVGTLTSGRRSRRDWLDMTTLLDIYLPYSNEMLTLSTASGQAAGGALLRIEPWRGPPQGPYRELALGVPIPGSPLSMAPGAMVARLHCAANEIWEKVIDQGVRQKDITACGVGTEQDIENANAAADGDFVKMDNPQMMQMLRFGGANQQSVALGMMLRQMFTYFFNLDALGGLGPSSGTLGQDRMIAESASRMVNNMADEVVAFVRDTCRDLAWHRWHAGQTRNVVRTIAGVQFTTPFGPDYRRGDWIDYAIDVEPYSMMHRSPQERMAMLDQIVTRYVLPMIGPLSQQGVAFDFNRFMALLADYSDLPELDELLIRQGPAQLAVDDEGAARSAFSHRTYERVNRPAAATQQREEAMAMSLMGQTPQPAEMASVMR